MRYNRWASAIIGLSVLCLGSWLLASCSTSRTATRSEVSSSRIQGSRDTVREQVVVEVYDTLREVTTITIRENEQGDTLKLVQITDRTRATDRAAARDKEEKLIVRTDTVYVAVRDSVSSFRFQDSGSTNKKSPFVSSLKWICFIILGLIGLIITVKVCYHR